MIIPIIMHDLKRPKHEGEINRGRVENRLTARTGEMNREKKNFKHKISLVQFIE
jgi:hypothetical protein